MSGIGMAMMVVVLVSAGCVTQPAPIVIYADRWDSIWLKFDPAAGSGHSHPVSIAPEQMAKVLHGVRVTDRDVIGAFGLFADQEGTPAFSAAEITRLAPYLSQALNKASPRDMVTFYLMAGDATRGRLVTSGGLFVRDGRLYFILANLRTSPSSGQYETPYEIDTRDEPLLPIARYKFTVGFTPSSAWIPNAQVRGRDGYERYMDESKQVVIDLQRLFAEMDRPASTPAPPSSTPVR